MKPWMVPLSLLLTDAAIFGITPLIALWIRFEGSPDPRYLGFLLQQLPVIIGVRLVCFAAFGLYRRLWRYASIPELLAIFGAVSAGTVLLFLWALMIGQRMPLSVIIMTWLLNSVLTGFSRLGVRVLSYLHYRSNPAISKVLIVGAGDAGAMIAREIQNAYQGKKILVGFIDDDPAKQGQRLFGVRVLGNRRQIAAMVERFYVNEIIIALPSAGGAVVREILNECKGARCKVQTVPGIYEVLDGRVSVSELRNIDVEDLLRREPVRLDLDKIAGYLEGKRVLVTGAGGSIGSELCRQIVQMKPAQLLLLGKGENSIYEIHQELKEPYREMELWPLIADVRDERRIRQIWSEYRPQVVFHAAAHKHVPLMEAQPVEAIRNNICGTRTVAQASAEYGAERFVLVSTDKAVNPSSVMGATKRVAELVIQALHGDSSTRFCAVRFGNVLGSRGSVIPLFKKQIAAGGPVTVTHPDMIRYFMTIPEAVQLILQAGAMTEGGEVFVLDMGQPVRIQDLARDLIELSGFVPDKDITIQYTGVRPGEKLFEELLTAEEGTTATKHEKIFTANISRKVSREEMERILTQMERETDEPALVEHLHRLVKFYKRMEQSA